MVKNTNENITENLSNKRSIKLFDHATPNQPCKFKTKNWVEINDESRGTHNEDT